MPVRRQYRALGASAQRLGGVSVQNRWRLATLGTCELRAPDGTLVKAASKKGLALLAYLAASRDRRASRDRVAALLWGYCDEAQARLNLRKCLSLLRQHATAHGFELPVDSEAETLSLPRDRVEWDGDDLNVADVGESADARLKALNEAYGGEFLDELNLRGADDFEDWLRIERQRLRSQYVAGVMNLLKSADLDSELRHDAALRLVAVDPLDEAAHRLLIRIVAERGQASAAIKIYRAFEQRLLRELQTRPDPETIALVESIGGKARPASAQGGEGAMLLPEAQPRQLQSSLLATVRALLQPIRRHLVVASTLGTLLAGAACVAVSQAAGLSILPGSRDAQPRAVMFASAADDELYSAALTHLESGDPERVKTASLLLGQLRSAEPRNVQAHLRYAEAMIFLGNRRSVPFETAKREASDAVEQALAIDPQSADAYLANGMLHQFLLWNYGDDADRRIALESLGKAASLEPNAKTLTAYGAALYMADRYEDAVPVLERAIALNPTAVDAQTQLAIALEATGKVPEGFRQALRTDRLYPNTTAAKNAATWILVDHGQLSRALPIATSSARIDGNLIAKSWIVTVDANLGRSQQALDTLNSFTGDAAPTAAIMRQLLQRQYTSALDGVEKELSRSDDPMWPMAAVELATILGRNQLALRYVKRGSPDLLAPSPVIARLDVPMALTAAQAFANAGNSEQARRIAQSALDGPLSTGHYVVPADFVWRSAAYCVLGQKDRALAEFETAYRKGYRLLVTRDNFLPVEDYPMFAKVRSEKRFKNVLAAIARANSAEAAKLGSGRSTTL